MQIEGSKTGRELPGIVDEVITMASLTTDDGKQFRAFICHTMNQWGYPAKDRSGKLNLLEEPNLQKLFAKMSTVSTERDMEFVDPIAKVDGTHDYTGDTKWYWYSDPSASHFAIESLGYNFIYAAQYYLKLLNW